MPYIGRDLNRGNYLKLDDISSSFNSSTKTFNLTVGGSAFTPGSAFSILVSVGGVIQEPESAYQVNNSEITFANAPTAQDSFFCIALGVPISIGVPGNSTVNGTQMAKPFNYDGFFYLNDTSNRVGINSSIPTASLDVIGDIKLNGSLVNSGGGGLQGNVYAASGISTFYDVRVTNNLTVEGTTTTLDTNLIGVDRVEVGANSNSIVGVAITQSGTADIVRLYDGASQVVTVDDEGKVGIGTANPTQNLHILGSSTSTVLIRASTLNGTAKLQLQDSLGRDNFIAAEGADNLVFAADEGNAGADSYMRFKVDGDEKVRITSAGKVGIATDTGDGLINTRHAGTNQQILHLRADLGSSNGRSLNLYTPDTDNTNAPFRFQTGNGYLFQCDGEDVFTIAHDRKVGISSSIPSQKLDVNGTVKATNFVGALPISSDGNNRVITATGSGGLNGESTLTYDGTSIFELQPSSATPARFIGDANRTGQGQHLAQFEGNWNGTLVGRMVVVAGEDTSNKDDGHLDFYTTPSGGSNIRRVRIDSGGRLLVGTATTKTLGSGQYGVLNVEGYAGASNLEAFMSLSRGEVATTMSNNDEVANITFNDKAGYEFARIQVAADEATGTTDTPGRLVFRTTADGASSSTERLRIDSIGRVLIGGGSSPTQVGDGRLIVYASERLHPAIKADCLDGGSNAANGFTMLADNYQADESLTNIGLSYSGAGLVLSRGVKVSNSADNVYLSSTDTSAQKPTAFKLDNGGNFTFLNTNTSATTTTDSAVSLIERLRIDSNGRLKINHTSTSSKLADTWLSIYDANSDSSANDPAGIDKNYAMINLHNYGTGNNGNAAGIGFGAGSAFNYTKGSIAFQRQGSYGTGDLVFLTNNDQDSTMVNDTDEKLRITRDSQIIFSDCDVSIGRDTALANYADGSTTRTQLAVVKDGGGASSGFHEVAHFTGGNDSNDTGAIVRITQFNNDRGLYIKAGRGSGDQAKATFGLRNSAAVDQDIMRFIQGGRVSINEATYNDRAQLTITNTNGFNSASISSNTDNIFLISNTTSADGAYGASIGFSRVQYPDRRAAAITTVQNGTDEDKVGLAFWNHNNTNATSDIVEALRLDANGSLRTMSKGGYWQITSIHNGSGSGNWYNGSAPQRIYPNYIDNNTGYAEFYMTFHPSVSYSGWEEPTFVICGDSYFSTGGQIDLNYNGRTNSPNNGSFRCYHGEYSWQIYNDGDGDVVSGMRRISRNVEHHDGSYTGSSDQSVDYIHSYDSRYGTNSEPIMDQRSYIKIKMNKKSGTTHYPIQGHTVFMKFTTYTQGDKTWQAYMYYN